MRLNSTGLGIGTSSPATILDVSSPATVLRLTSTTGTNAVYQRLTNTGGNLYFGIDNSTGNDLATGSTAYAGVLVAPGSSSDLHFGTNGAVKATITVGGNFGIGTNSPQRQFTLYNATTPIFQLTNSASGTTLNDGTLLYQNGANFVIENQESGIIGFNTAATQRAQIDASGNLQINTTTSLDAVVSVVGRVGANAAPFSLRVGTSGDYGFTFKNDAGTFVGAIGVNASTTSYVTSSDYRLKENIVPMAGALATVSQLKPCTYTWKVDGAEGQGFIAHELAEIVPECVIGEKDAVDVDGNIKSQGIDTSFLVATLTAAIQEQQALITTLTERITALEGA
jgi:hypothetical protein